MDYRPQLDVLRAVAVLCVLFHHFWSNGSGGAGQMGVRLFFVLSGFLITKLLLERPSVLAFYRQRAARLLPAFGLAIALAVALNLPGMRATWPWHAANLTNLLLFLRGRWEVTSWPADHLWTVNVEWQFYLIWPFIVLHLPQRMLAYAFSPMLLVGPLYRSLWNDDTSWVLPFASMDVLGAGALLAIYRGPAAPIYAAGITCAPFLLWGIIDAGQIAEFGSVPTLAALVFAGWQGQLKLIELRSLVHLGLISYGVYLYHLFIWAVFFRLGIPIWPGKTAFVLLSAATVSTAWISYTFLEKPIRLWARHVSEAKPEVH